MLTILIIEDNEMFRKMAFEVFDGCNRIMAEDAEEGFEKFKEYCPDVTLLDIGLPGKNGLQLLPDLIGYDPEAFVVMLTASRISRDVNQAKKLGAAGYITKPFSFAKVSECMSSYRQYKRELESLSPEERAGSVIEKLRVEAVEASLMKKEEELSPELIHERKVEETLKSWNILFVDDYLTNTERAKTQLSKLGCNVETADSGEEVLKKIKKQNYNLIFLDSQMTGIDGYDTTRKIRATEKESAEHYTVIIGMVEHSYEIDDKLWQASGMNSFVHKPARFAQLQAAIEKYVSEEVDGISDRYVK